MKGNELSRRNFIKFGIAGGAAAMTGAAVAAENVTFDESYDVVVIGTGFAGLSCATKCAAAKLKVLLVDKMPVIGGNSAICGGFMAVPLSKYQKALGHKDSREAFIGDCLKDGLGINHVDLLNVIFDRARDAEELVESVGGKTDHRITFESGHSVPRSIATRSGTGADYVMPMYEALKKLPNVTFKTRCKFDDFVMNKEGRVVGIVCREGYKFNAELESDDVQNTSGTKKTFEAKRGVMLATGGFSRDKWFRQIQDPRVVPSIDSTNHPGATAGALLKAFDIGAVPVQISWLQFLPYCSPFEKGYGISSNIIEHCGFDYGMVVNPKTGKRFMDEHAGRKIKTDAMLNVIGNDENYPLAVFDTDAIAAINPAYTKAPLEQGTAKPFSTLDELADHYKMDKAAFKAEVERFNGFVKNGKDTDFGKPLQYHKGISIKTAPFYAIPCCPKVHHTMGGLLINTKAQVISSKTHEPIPGLYAGGEVTGGIHGASRLGTVAVADALTFGMVAGEQLSA